MRLFTRLFFTSLLLLYFCSINLLAFRLLFSSKTNPQCTVTSTYPSSLQLFWSRWLDDLEAAKKKDFKAERIIAEKSCHSLEGGDCLRMIQKSECSASWSQQLLHNEVERIIATKEFNENNSNKGGIAFMLSGGVKAYFKSPYSRMNSRVPEDYKSEIIAFHIDRILGFNRSPAVVERHFNASSLYSLAPSPRDLIHLKQMIDAYGVKRDGSMTLPGAMIGWLDCDLDTPPFFPPPLNSTSDHSSSRRIWRQVDNDLVVAECEKEDKMCSKKFNQWYGKSGKLNVLDILDSDDTKDRTKVAYALEWSRHTLFLVLLGMVDQLSHFDHNIHIMSSCRSNTWMSFLVCPFTKDQPRPIAHIDFDRASWIQLRKNSDLHLCSNVCVFPKAIITRLEETSWRRVEKGDSPIGLTLGEIVQRSLIVGVGHDLGFDQRKISKLDQSVDFLLECVEYCKTSHPQVADKLLIEDIVLHETCKV